MFKKKQEPKVGDRVRIDEANTGTDKGVEGKVIEIDSTYDYPYKVLIKGEIDFYLWCKATKLEEDSVMGKFKVGDKVKLKRGCSGMQKGDIGILKEYNNHVYAIKKGGKLGVNGCSCEGNWIKLGGTMNKYQELKDRIEGLDNGWTKEVDDIMQDMQNKATNYYLIIPNYDVHKIADSDIRIFDSNYCEVAKFKFDSQCTKMVAFKEALLWMLDKSDVSKALVGTTQKVKIEGKVYEAEIISEC